jgi:hypothetical protein
MVGWGIALIIIGAGSLLLPMLGYQFTLMELVDDFQPYAGIVVAIIGAALVLLGMNRQSGTTVEAPRATQAPSTGSGGSTTADEEPRPQP